MPYFAKDKFDDDVGAELLLVLIIFVIMVFACGAVCGIIIFRLFGWL